MLLAYLKRINSCNYWTNILFLKIFFPQVIPGRKINTYSGFKKSLKLHYVLKIQLGKYIEIIYLTMGIS